jgi:hypothetical protein
MKSTFIGHIFVMVFVWLKSNTFLASGFFSILFPGLLGCWKKSSRLGVTGIILQTFSFDLATTVETPGRLSCLLGILW